MCWKKDSYHQSIQRSFLLLYYPAFQCLCSVVGHSSEKRGWRSQQIRKTIQGLICHDVVFPKSLFTTCLLFAQKCGITPVAEQEKVIKGGTSVSFSSFHVRKQWKEYIFHLDQKSSHADDRHVTSRCRFWTGHGIESLKFRSIHLHVLAPKLDLEVRSHGLCSSEILSPLEHANRISFALNEMSERADHILPEDAESHADMVTGSPKQFSWLEALFFTQIQVAFCAIK